MDADLSHEPNFIYKLWENRTQAEVTIASRYCRGGGCLYALGAKGLSRIQNPFFRLGLSLPVLDLSSGFRIYRTVLLERDGSAGKKF